MNTQNSHNSTIKNSTSLELESLHYHSLFSNQEFKIDSNNNLHITSLLKDHNEKGRNEVVPLDLINPQPISKSRLNTPLMLLALASALASATFFAAAIFMGQLWTVAFAMVFWIFGMGTLFASYKDRTTVYLYKFANTETLLFTLSEPFTQNKHVEFFVNTLNRKIINLNEKSDENEEIVFNNEMTTPLDLSGEMEIYMHGKQSQYTKHLDFLFNHGIVDEVLYKKLNNKINTRIADSENRFLPDTSENQAVPNNVIKFPVNA